MSRNYIMENFKINSNIFHGNASNNFEFMGTSGHKSLFNKLTCFPQNQNYYQNRFKMQIGKKNKFTTLVFLYYPNQIWDLQYKSKAMAIPSKHAEIERE